MTYVEYRVSNRIGYITLNRPEKRNALSYELISGLKEAFVRAERDDEVKVIVLKANGETFCAGADLEHLRQLQDYSFEQNLADSTHMKELFLKIYELKKLVIAQVQGDAIAGGCGLATVCDFVFAVPEAKFAYREVRIGFIPAIVMVFLLRKIGEGHAKNLLLSGSFITAETARQTGLINEIHEAQDLANAVEEFARKLITLNSGYAMGVTKQMIAKIQTLGLEEGATFAAEMNAKSRESEDCRRGISAFLNKEKIKWD